MKAWPPKDLLEILVMKFTADAITKAREAKGLSKTKLAREVGTTRTTAERWENGRNQIRPGLLARICEVLGVAPSTMLPNRKQFAELKEVEQQILSELPVDELVNMTQSGWAKFVDQWEELETNESRAIRSRLDAKGAA